MPPDAASSPPDRDPTQKPPDLDIARAAYMAVPVAGFILDENGHILLHTRRAHRLYGTGETPPGDTLEGVPFETLTDLDPETVRGRLRTCLAGGSVTFPMREAYRLGRTKQVPFHISLMRVPGITRQLLMLSQDHLSANADALKTAHDLVDRETTRGLALEAHITELQRAVLSMETFAHAASHDLKTPINTLSAMLTLFGDKFATDLPDQARTYLDHIAAATRQMDTLTTKLLAHARSAAAPMDVTQVSLTPAVNGAIAMLDPALLDAVAPIAVRGPKFDIMAESTMLQILVGNLLTNALKHGGDQRALEVTVITSTVEDGGSLTIVDNGRGFDPNHAHSIFAPFLRLNEAVQGSGLGLATCAEICRRHGWEINAQSDGRSGATFTVHFPSVLMR